MIRIAMILINFFLFSNLIFAGKPWDKLPSDQETYKACFGSCDDNLVTACRKEQRQKLTECSLLQKPAAASILTFSNFKNIKIVIMESDAVPCKQIRITKVKKALKNKIKWSYRQISPASSDDDEKTCHEYLFEKVQRKVKTDLSEHEKNLLMMKATEEAVDAILSPKEKRQRLKFWLPLKVKYGYPFKIVKMLKLKNLSR